MGMAKLYHGPGHGDPSASSDPRSPMETLGNVNAGACLMLMKIPWQPIASRHSKNAWQKGLGYLTISGMWIFDQQIWSCAILSQAKNIFGEWDLEGLPPRVWLKSDF